jgi:hypothetical protein
MVTTGPIDLTGLPPERQLLLARGLKLLAVAHEDAVATGDNPWQFAVPVAELLDAGLAGVDVRWIIVHGLADHAHEQPGRDRGKRVFAASGELTFARTSCLILSTEMVVAIREWSSRAAEAVAIMPVARPCWDPELRILHLGGVLVKRFRGLAPSQEQILAVFQEEGWPPRIDDPLPPGTSEDLSERLHAAVRGLNRGQVARRIRFTRDGRGEGVCWVAVDPARARGRVNLD